MTMGDKSGQILMKYAGIAGDSQLSGKAGYLELSGFAWGVASTHSLQHGAKGASRDRQVANVSITREQDANSAALLREALCGQFDKKVEVVFIRTGTTKPAVYASYEFEKCGVCSYSITADGGTPIESLQLNFAKVTFKAYRFKDDLSAVPESTFYDLASGTGG